VDVPGISAKNTREGGVRKQTNIGKSKTGNKKTIKELLQNRKIIKKAFKKQRE